MIDDSDSLYDSMFTEPADFRPKSPEPTCHQININEKTFQITLVGNHSLWAHCVWNAGIVVAKYIESNQIMFKNKSVLEFGAGAMLPSLVSAISGASIVVSTDYPESSLLDTMQHNAILNVPDQVLNGCLKIEGYLWGSDPASISAHLPTNELFDFIIMADLIFNHSQHQALVDSTMKLLSRESISRVLVAFTHHRPWLSEKDMDFFKVAENCGFVVDHLFDCDAKEMFEKDAGDLKVRQTVHFYTLRWP